MAWQGRRGRRVRLFNFFVLSTRLFSSYQSSSFPITSVSFSVEYTQQQADKTGRTDTSGDGSVERGGWAGRHDGYVFCK